tara:strand:- start:1775 stop:3037 length:1263 start_codon:yes stop_codon:yes gene_type:complete
MNKTLIEKNLSLKNILIIFILSIIFCFTYYFLISNSIIYPTVSPMVNDSKLFIFADWSVIIKANLCDNLGQDVYINNSCDPFGRNHVYGGILLYFPFVENFQKFYLIVLPIIINFIFIYIILYLFTLNNKLYLLPATISIFSFPVILSIERANFDIVIFIFLFLISLFRNKIFNFLTLIFLTISKFYPIILGINFFFEKNMKKFFLNSLVFITLISLFVLFQYKELLKIYENLNQFKSYGIYSFSFTSIIFYLEKFEFLINNKNYNYWFLFLVLIIPSLIIFIFTFKCAFQNKTTFELNKDNFEDKIYFLSSTVIIVCFFVFSNFVYREIFLLGLIPFILKKMYLNDFKKFFKNYYYFLILKFLVSFPITYLYMNKLLVNLKLTVIFKYILDIYIVALVGALFVAQFYWLFQNVLIKDKD